MLPDPGSVNAQTSIPYVMLKAKKRLKLNQLDRIASMMDRKYQYRCGCGMARFCKSLNHYLVHRHRRWGLEPGLSKQNKNHFEPNRTFKILNVLLILKIQDQKNMNSGQSAGISRTMVSRFIIRLSLIENILSIFSDKKPKQETRNFTRKQKEAIMRNRIFLGLLVLIVFLTPAAVKADITRIIGTGEANNQSQAGSISGDGRYVAFQSSASNMVLDDTNGCSDIFVRDRQAGTTTRVSLDSSGNQADGHSTCPVISKDGRYVAFISNAANLASGDANATWKIFMHDRQTHGTTCISIGSGDVIGVTPSLSENGRYLAFTATANNLPNARSAVFVHDNQTGITTCISVDSRGFPANNNSSDPSISDDGRYVVFESNATNLVPRDTNNFSDVFLHDRQTGITTRTSVDSGGVQGNGISDFPSLSGDGRYVVFRSGATNLAPNDPYYYDIFIHDRETGMTTKVSVDSSGNRANGHSTRPVLSRDGRYVAFESNAANLVTGDDNNRWDIFLHDRQTGGTSRVSVNSNGNQANANSSNPKLSGDGRYVTFGSWAANLIPDDTNAKFDVFVHDCSNGQTARASMRAMEPYHESSNPSLS
ncbi:MAG: hypothetical protein EHM45_22235, partial [Desulfobacteraceae bacterium]